MSGLGGRRSPRRPCPAAGCRRGRWLAALLLLGAACRSPPPPPPRALFVAQEVGLELPSLPGWASEHNGVAPAAATEGGVALRLVRGAQLAGAPRVDVVLEPGGGHPTILEEFLARSLRQMADLEHAGQIRIDHVEQRRAHVGRLPAYRVRHEYTLGRGAQQVAIVQISTFFVDQGRGIAVTAVGRVELFHPVADQVARMMETMRMARGPGSMGPLPAAGPTDLGRVGGSRRGEGRPRAP